MDFICDVLLIVLVEVKMKVNTHDGRTYSETCKHQAHEEAILTSVSDLKLSQIQEDQMAFTNRTCHRLAFKNNI